MNPVSRKNYILDALKKTGEVTVIRLSEELKVTSETIRRDLSQLADEGQLVKIHGGALRKQIFREDNFAERLKTMRPAKEAIGRAAVSLISANDIIFIDSCTTTLTFATQLPAVPLTVFTNSSLIAESIKQNNPYARVYVLGGEYNLEFRANLGAAVIEQINSIQADTCFLGAGGITQSNGIQVKSIDEAYVSKAMLRMSKKKVILADHTKFGQEGVMSIATPGEVDHIITDALLDKKVYPLQDFNNKITLA
ncbi:DeoR/GlpR family DNA-binding transcription regulator [Citrobacter sp. CK198]|uniref:DeoR/GlpR family DNA-binding transcription regulator n=1 Tax=Citrobacter sp. CK198 TaxID=2985107 RepID=UPI0025772750|nr:DeoR/GlpR family DNA-binding transcription regulator [Citrobacter sp. CK198]MDM2974078.1 DeoR/GlpR family DNA-binding transcription regulator [Citrobacter sp. CK198]